MTTFSSLNDIVTSNDLTGSQKLAELKSFALQFSAEATKTDAVLFAGAAGDTGSAKVADFLAKTYNLAQIGDTARAAFLSSNEFDVSLRAAMRSMPASTTRSAPMLSTSTCRALRPPRPATAWPTPCSATSSGTGWTAPAAPMC